MTIFWMVAICVSLAIISALHARICTIIVNNVKGIKGLWYFLNVYVILGSMMMGFRNIANLVLGNVVRV